MEKALESYWKGQTDRETLLSTLDEQFLTAIKTQIDQQIDVVPSGDFTFYDHVLDTAVMFNWIPERFRSKRPARYILRDGKRNKRCRLK